jgi:hypothetical protein
MKTKHHHIILSAPAAQSGDRTLNNPIRPRWFALALGGLLFTSIFALPAPLVEAGCQQYDVSGQWVIRQGSFNIPVTLSQNGKTVSGTAYHESLKDRHRNLVLGRVSGTMQGDTFEVQITWAGGGAGIYRGTVNQRGVLDGTTYDMNNPSSTAIWTSDKSGGVACADAAPAPPAPPKVIKSSGKAKPATAPSPDTAAAADDWINQELRKRKTATQPTPSASNRPRGFINGLQNPTPTPSPEAAESSSDDTQDQHKKHKKNKHHHHDDDQDQGND